MMRPLLLVTLLLLPLAAAQGNPIQLQSGASATASATVGQEAVMVHFAFPFKLTEARPAYVKVVPSPGNPVFANGTAGSTGWWTEVRLDGPDGVQGMGVTTGNVPVELGTLTAGTTYRLLLDVHAPAAALVSLDSIKMTYGLAVRAASSGTGNGGELNPSVSLRATLHVVAAAIVPVEPVVPPVETTITNTPVAPPSIVETTGERGRTQTAAVGAWDPLWVIGLNLLLVLLAIILFVALLLRRRGRRDDDKRRGDRGSRDDPPSFAAPRAPGSAASSHMGAGPGSPPPAHPPAHLPPAAPAPQSTWPYPPYPPAPSVAGPYAPQPSYASAPGSMPPAQPAGSPPTQPWGAPPPGYGQQMHVQPPVSAQPDTQPAWQVPPWTAPVRAPAPGWPSPPYPAFAAQGPSAAAQPNVPSYANPQPSWPESTGPPTVTPSDLGRLRMDLFLAREEAQALRQELGLLNDEMLRTRGTLQPQVREKRSEAL